MSARIALANGVILDLAADPLDLSDLTIGVVAHALAQINRFTGHASRPISVAEHSVGVSYLAPKWAAREALMHDAHECLVGDVAAPLKRLLPDYRAIEARVERAVWLRFGLGADPAVREAVAIADRQALEIEARALMPVEHSAATRAAWAGCFTGSPIPIWLVERERYWMDRARLFLERAEELGVR